MVMAIAKELDGASVNPLDRKRMAGVIAGEALAGEVEYCTDFLKAYRKRRFGLK